MHVFGTYSRSTGSSISFLTSAFWGKRTLLEHTHTALVTIMALISVLNECGEINTYHFIGYLSLEGNKSDKGEFTRKNAQGGRHFQHINCGIYWSQTSKINWKGCECLQAVWDMLSSASQLLYFFLLNLNM